LPVLSESGTADPVAEGGGGEGVVSPTRSGLDGAASRSMLLGADEAKRRAAAEGRPTTRPPARAPNLVANIEGCRVARGGGVSLWEGG
jgi:hypothetical protein